MSLELVNPENVAAIREAIASGSASGQFAPAVYIVEPVSNCNVKCIMCPNHRLPTSDLGHATIESLEISFNAISKYAELVMLYFMGEPTLHPDFSRVMRSARSILSGRIVVSTNAKELSNDHIDALVENSDIVITCLDRWNKTEYEKIRKGADFSRVVENIERLLVAARRREGLVVVVKSLDILTTNLSREQVEAERLEFTNYWSGRGAVVLGGWLNTWAGQMPNLTRLTTLPTPYTPANRTPCADTWFKMVVNWRGEIVLCCHNWNYSVKLGELKANVLEIWQSEPFVNARTAQLGLNFAGYPICAGCAEWGEPSELDSYLTLGTDDLWRVF